MAAVGSIAPVAVSPTWLAAVCSAAGSVSGASGRCGAHAAWATTPLVKAIAMTILSMRFVIVMTMAMSSASGYRRHAFTTLSGVLRHVVPPGRRAPSTLAHNHITRAYAA